MSRFSNALVAGFVFATQGAAAQKASVAPISQAEYAARRSALAGRVPEGVLLVLGAGEPAQDYLTFSQEPRFEYLTGIREPDAALVMVKRPGVTPSFVVFTEAKDPAREVWTGQRLGAREVNRTTGMTARTRDELRPFLDSLLSSPGPLHVVADYQPQRPRLSHDDQFIASLKKDHPGVTVQSASLHVDQLRGKKSAAEQALLRKSIDVTVASLTRAMAEGVRPGGNEYEAQAMIEYGFRFNGADRPSFATIVASGPNSTTLHYNKDDRPLRTGEVVVMDVGSSYQGYAADVTRTVPVGGVYTPPMRDIYTIVRNAQAAAEKAATLNAPAQLMSDSATAVIARGLTQLGLIESPTATYDCVNNGAAAQCAQYQLYYMHGLGHGIGLEVHDPEQFYFTGKIEPGSAFTIEPGIYVREGLIDIIPDTPRNRAIKDKLRAAVAKYANIGVRIEDDYIATEKGVEWVSKAPREMGEIEALMRKRIVP